MSDTFLLLEREVERLVTVPYAPSLQDLYYLVNETSSGTISSWVAHKPCQIGALVDIIVEGLPRSKFALDLLARFAWAPEFRNSLLERYPYILDQFLARGVENGESKYISFCIAALSSPLPPGFIAPASLSPFIMKMINIMRENPCTETITPLYSMSSCLEGSARVLSEIPSEIMSSFQTELTKTLRNLDDHMGNLLCLATFAKIASSQNVGVERRKLKDPLWLENIKHFFGPKRGSKTLDLVILRTILACSSNCGNLTIEQSVESIRLAIDICGNVEQGQKDSWIAGNSAKLVKLCEKITRKGIDDGVQILGVTFLACLVPPSALSTDLAGIALEWIMSDDSRLIGGSLPPHLIRHLLAASIACARRPTINRVLDYILSALDTNLIKPTSLSRLHKAKELLFGLRNNPSLAEPALEKCKDVIDQLMETFPRHPIQPKCDGSSTCSSLLVKLENELTYGLFDIYFQASLSQNTRQETSNSVHFNNFIIFMTNNKCLLPDFKCSFAEIKPLNLRASFPAPETNSNTVFSRCDWRVGMTETIMTSMSIFNDNIIKKVGGICYELEQRCDNIEAPLRAVEEERDKANFEAEQLKQKIQVLDSRLHQKSDTIAELREELSRIESHANSVTSRAERLSSSLEQAQKEIEDIRRKCRETVSNERELARTRELDLMASLTEKDERLEEMQEEIKRQSGENCRLVEVIEVTSKDKDSSLENIASLRQEISMLQEELEKKQSLLMQRDCRIEQLLEDNTIENNAADELRAKLEERNSKVESLASTINEYKAEIDALKKQSNQQISKLADECAKRKEENLSLQRAMQEAASNAAKELQAREKQIQLLERKVQHLQEQRAAKAREFSEAQQHIGRLMGVMGFKPGTVESRGSDKQRPLSSVESSRRATIQRQTSLGEGHSQSRDDELIMSLGANVSHSGGRSPKRSRNSAFPIIEPSPHRQHVERRPKVSTTPSNWNSTRQRERKPLRDIDQNSQQSTQQNDTPSSTQCGTFQESEVSDQMNENRLEEIGLDMDLEFSKDFLFTSTALSESNEPTMV